MKDLTFDISGIALVEVLVVGVALFILLRIAFLALRRINLRRKSQKIWQRFLPIAEAVIWFLFFVWGAKILLNDPLWYSIVVLLVSVVIMIWVGWFALRDVVAGLILRLDAALSVGEKLSLPFAQGRITSMGFRSLSLESDRGEVISVPYSKITGEMRVSAQPSQTVHSQAFRLKVPQTEDLEGVINKTKTQLLTAPWFSLNREPQIKILEENENYFFLEAVIYAIEPTYFEKIKKYLMQANEDVVVFNGKLE
ncbi:mechanosensitive ion channel [Flammeovirgaceae bacterium SG7u.111]|nr:mechanosensitive ion channel [Flammeovirgaceae bacterium SG7u.132]WPO36067.1 mechanosensitive ion channel [Flammeovirgaceae bacterium SG7u.111]